MYFLGLAKPDQKKNANAAITGGRMVIKPEADDGATGGGFIDRLIETTKSMTNRKRYLNYIAPIAFCL